MKRMLSLLYTSALLFLTVCLLSMLLSWKLTGKMSIFGIQPLFIATDSMEPVIPAKSFVLTRPIDAEDVKVGDIVAYRYQSATGKIPVRIVHRVIRINDDQTYILKGDHEEEPDDPVRADQILYIICSISS